MKFRCDICVTEGKSTTCVGTFDGGMKWMQQHIDDEHPGGGKAEVTSATLNVNLVER